MYIIIKRAQKRTKPIQTFLIQWVQLWSHIDNFISLSFSQINAIEYLFIVVFQFYEMHNSSLKKLF